MLKDKKLTMAGASEVKCRMAGDVREGARSLAERALWAMVRSLGCP